MLDTSFCLFRVFLPYFLLNEDLSSMSRALIKAIHLFCISGSFGHSSYNLLLWILVYHSFHMKRGVFDIRIQYAEAVLGRAFPSDW